MTDRDIRLADYSDHMADAMRYAFINMPKLTLWQRIKMWFRKLFNKLLNLKKDK